MPRTTTKLRTPKGKRPRYQGEQSKASRIREILSQLDAATLFAPGAALKALQEAGVNKVSMATLTSTPALPCFNKGKDDMTNSMQRRVVCYDCLNQGIRRFFFNKRDLAAHKLAIHGVDMSRFEYNNHIYHIMRTKKNGQRGYLVTIQLTDHDPPVMTSEFLVGVPFGEARNFATSRIDELIERYQSK